MVLTLAVNHFTLAVNHLLWQSLTVLRTAQCNRGRPAPSSLVPLRTLYRGHVSQQLPRRNSRALPSAVMHAREHVPRNANQRAAAAAGRPTSAGSTRINAIDELVRDRAAPGGLRQQTQEYPSTAPIEATRRGFDRGSPESTAASMREWPRGSPSVAAGSAGAGSPPRPPSLIRRAAEATSSEKAAPASAADADDRLQQVERMVALQGAVVQQLVSLPPSQQATLLLAQFEADLEEYSVSFHIQMTTLQQKLMGF